MKKTTLVYIQFILGIAVGTTIACSPTKFSNPPSALCDSSADSCVVENGKTSIVQNFKVGAGKVDILFVDDNSASMSSIQSKMAAKFAGFIETLDRNEINYQIGITTTDIAFSTTAGLETFGSGQNVLRNSDSNRVGLFNSSIVRSETVACESFIKSAYYTYGPAFNLSNYYAQNYNKYCASGDERGIYSAFEVISKNISSLIRPDANLNIIVVSNEDVRSSLYRDPQYAATYALDNKDKAVGLIDMINTTYPGKYWEFNSIITKDSACAAQQQLSFTDKNGLPIKDSSGNYVIGSNIGLEYAAVSASASKDVDGNSAPRGQILNICNSDYATHFSNIAAKISDSARLLTLKCKPTEAPVITDSNGVLSSIPYSWDGDSKIIFQKGSEGIKIKVAYKCYTGVI